MTTIKVCRSGRNLKIDITGHSGYAPSGQDIVCAGISALSQTAEMMFAKMEADGELEVFTAEKSVGKLMLAVKSYKHTRTKATGVYEFFCTGAKLIADNYPTNVLFITLDGGEKNQN